MCRRQPTPKKKTLQNLLLQVQMSNYIQAMNPSCSVKSQLCASSSQIKLPFEFGSLKEALNSVCSGSAMLLPSLPLVEGAACTLWAGRAEGADPVKSTKRKSKTSEALYKSDFLRLTHDDNFLASYTVHAHDISTCNLPMRKPAINAYNTYRAPAQQGDSQCHKAVRES